jgi:hypothetical protein
LSNEKIVYSPSDICTTHFNKDSYNDNKGGVAMNFNPIFPPVVTNLPPVFTTLPPIVTRRVNIVNRPQIITQPHIQENITQIQNQIIKRNVFCDRPQCCESSCFHEENCHMGCCPGPMMPQPFGPQQFGPQPGFVPGPVPGFGPVTNPNNNIDLDIDINQGMF